MLGCSLLVTAAAADDGGNVAPESLKWGIGFSATGALAVLAIIGLMRIKTTEQSENLDVAPEGVAVSSTTR